MSEISEKTVPDDFKKIINDFYRDILRTFPEYSENIDENIEKILNGEMENNYFVEIYDYCSREYPKKFFDILYEREDMFTDDSCGCYFLPNINFKSIWSENISENTRSIIWKYLQLVLFSVSKDLESSESFGDTAKLFEAIDENEFKSKMEETIEKMHEIFDMSDNMFDMDDASGVNVNDLSSNLFGNMPDAEKMHDHINKLLNGKLGQLAQEIADETTKELGIDLNNVDSMDNVGDVFKQMFKNPGKLMNMVKKVGNKLDEKIKSGKINQDELMSEARNMMSQMKNMPGMGNMDKMMQSMMGGKGKMAGFNNFFKENMKKSNQRDRMLKKLEERKKQKQLLQQKNTVVPKKNKQVFEHIKFKPDGEEGKRSSVVKKKKKKNKKNKKNKKKK